MTATQNNINEWLGFEEQAELGLYKTQFEIHHLGNIFIKSLHGGVTGATIEMAAESLTKANLDEEANLMIVSSSVDYLRITKDADLFARANLVRLSRRLSVVDVKCWQDDEATPIAQGVVTIKIDRA